MLTAQEAEEADLDDTADHEGAQLLCSRRDIWQDECQAQALQLWKRVHEVEARVAAAESKASAETTCMTAVDRYAWERMQLERALMLHTEEKARHAPPVVHMPVAAQMAAAPRPAIAVHGGSQPLQLVQPNMHMLQHGGGMLQVPHMMLQPGSVISTMQQQSNITAQLAALQASVAGQRPQQLPQYTFVQQAPQGFHLAAAPGQQFQLQPGQLQQVQQVGQPMIIQQHPGIILQQPQQQQQLQQQQPPAQPQ